MPRHVTLAELPQGWTQVTINDVTKIRLQLRGARMIQVQRGGTTEPTLDGAIDMLQGPILPATLVLDDLWPGATGSRVWVYSPIKQGGLSVSHA